ncbi:MAG: phosphoribosyl-AMP cyclohydrolase [Halioglobus sp.]
MSLTQHIKWNSDGLVAAIAQDWQSGDVLMMAWMNADALELTLSEQRAVYYSRSRQKLWRKGEASGNVQQLKELRLDCDGDTVLLKVEQIGGIACHTGRKNCFYRLANTHGELSITDDVLREPDDMYGNNQQ